MKIAITGKQCSGKTTLKDFLVKKYGGKEVKFIDKLYQINKLLDVDKNRGFMQDLGESVRRHFGQDYFVNDFIKRTKDFGGNLFCDDVRKVVEFNAVKVSGLFTVYLEADHYLRKQRAESLNLEFIEEHPAEMEIELLKDRCDIMFENNQGIDKIEEFASKISSFIKG